MPRAAPPRGGPCITFPRESANLTRYSVLTQSGLAALAQANQQSQSVLSLLR